MGSKEASNIIYKIIMLSVRKNIVTNVNRILIVIKNKNGLELFILYFTLTKIIIIVTHSEINSIVVLKL